MLIQRNVEAELLETPVEEIKVELEEIRKRTKTVLKRRHKKKSIRYYNVPCAFDIETTNYKKSDLLKYAWMYEWTFGIEDTIIIGRTWTEYLQLTNILTDVFELNDDQRLFVGIHNLTFEFQFMRNYFVWNDVFAVDKLKPVKAISAGGLEYRDTAILSGLPLYKVAENLNNHKIAKLYGDLDYSKIRTPNTYMTKDEYQYCINDVRILLYYLYEQMDLFGDISKIVLTNTGRVREYFKKNCLYKTKNGKKVWNWDYTQKIKDLTLTPDLYYDCWKGFRGGFTHANARYVGSKLANISSYDLTSAYPSVMVYEQFPSGTPSIVNDIKGNRFEWYLKNRCCLFQATFKNLQRKENAPDSYLSWIPDKMEATGLDNSDNGRIISATTLTIYITEIDYEIIEKVYDFDSVEIANMVVWFKDYLPKELIQCLLKFYADKTQLKGVEDKVIEYQNSKGMLNSGYGCMVMNILQDVNTYEDNEWQFEYPSVNETITKYNVSRTRFNYYAWGLWITAYCRRLIWKAILECGKDDYIYTDTDSVKFKNLPAHKEFFDKMNESITEKCNKAMRHYNLDEELTRPETIKGSKKQLGVFDYEGDYEYFKTLGAKRYMTSKKHTWGKKEKICPLVKYDPRYNYSLDGTYTYTELTVAGLGKTEGSKYINTFENPWRAFNQNLQVPKEHSGKLGHSYCHEPITDLEIDGWKVDSKSYVFLEPIAYSLSMEDDFIDLIMQIGNTRY